MVCKLQGGLQITDMTLGSKVKAGDDSAVVYCLFAVGLILGVYIYIGCTIFKP